MKPRIKKRLMVSYNEIAVFALHQIMTKVAAHGLI